MVQSKPTFVLATVGTDHHPFDRFVEWIDSWQSRHAECEVFIQRGATLRVPTTGSAKWLRPAELDSMMRRADAVVCHGGPATIMEARRAGVVPVVIPRNPAMGEHVDDHQIRFTDFMAGKGAVLAAHSQADLSAHLRCVTNGGTGRIIVGSPRDTLDQISMVVDRVMEQRCRPVLGTWSRRS